MISAYIQSVSSESCEVTCDCDFHEYDYDEKCHVDCSDNVKEACQSVFDSIYNETLPLLLESFTRSNGSITIFEEMINDTLQTYFGTKHEECTAGSAIVSYTANILIVSLLFIFFV